MLAGWGEGTAAGAADTVKNGTISAFRHVMEALLQRDTLLVLGAGLVMAALLAPVVARRLHARRVLSLAALVSVACIVALTVVPRDGLAALAGVEAPESFRELALFSRSEWRAATTGWADGTDGPLNVLLFMPAGFLWGLVVRRRVLVLGGLAGLSLAIELYQGISGTRITNPADVVANTIGAGVGIVMAIALREVWRVVRS